MKRDEATPPRPPSRGDEEGELPQGGMKRGSCLKGRMKRNSYVNEGFRVYILSSGLKILNGCFSMGKTFLNSH
jgi:hypothetical protein